MSDIIEQPGAATPVESGDTSQPAPDQETSTEVDLFDTGADTFPREYVEKLRKEAGDYRTKYAPYRDAFGDVSEEVQEYLLDLNRLLISPDKSAAAAELKDLLKHLEPGSPEAAKVEAAIESTEVEEDKPLTLKEWKSIQEGEKAKAAETDSVEQIYSQARELSTDWANYDKDADEFGDMASLLFVATNKTKGDLEAAHKLRADRYEAAVSEEVDKRLNSIREGSLKWAPIVSTGTSPAEEPVTPKTWEDARKRANSRISRILEG